MIVFCYTKNDTILRYVELLQGRLRTRIVISIVAFIAIICRNLYHTGLWFSSRRSVGRISDA